MATKTKQWEDGSSATIQYGGQGDGQIIITSDPNEHYEARSMQITVETTNGSPKQTKTITINQAAKQRIDLSAAVVTASNQTYSGSAKTPVPTVTLNGSTVPSTGYDVSYSNNTNAGTATITITGKGDYTGTASGTFTIAPAAPSYTAPTAKTLTYSGSSQALVNAGNSSDGTFTYKLSTASSYGSSIPTGTNAGSYTVNWKFVADANHGGGTTTGNVNVTISQKSLTITAKAQSISYGNSIATGTSQVTTSGLVSGDSLTAITLTASTSNVTTSGTITPSAASTTKGASNYSITYSTGNLTITAVPASVTAAPTAKSLTYNRGSQSLVNAGTANGGTMYYYATTTNSKPSSTSSFSSSIPTKTNAGTYYVWYYVKGDSNHTNTAISSTSVSVTISKATPVISTAPSKRTGLSYTGSAQNLLSGGSVKHSSSDSTSVGGTFTYAQGTNAGTYSSLTWSFAPTDSTNYNSTSGSISGSVSIAKASRTLSFTDSYVVLNTSSNTTKTATPSAGSGDGAITYSISSTTYATINSSSGKVTSKTSDGSATVIATIAEGTNYLSATATYTLYVFATTHNYDYNGSYRSVTLPPGTYQFQVWGAQGGSNATDPSFGITAQAGGKGGYSVGQLTISQATGIRVYVGGNGTTSGDGNVGAFNGGGAVNWGSSTKDEDGEYGKTRFGGGGGATDIRLSDGSLYSRMIVAGGGSGGAMCYSKKTTYQDVYTPLTTSVSQEFVYGGQYVTRYTAGAHQEGDVLRVYVDNSSDAERKICFLNSAGSFISTQNLSNKTYKTVTCPANTAIVIFQFIDSRGYSYNYGTVNADLVTQEEVVTETNVSQVGYPGGGTNGGGYSSAYYGKQNGAGNEGSFGSGAIQYAGSQRYVSGAGGGGWYGGGRGYSNTTTDGVKYSGGGSGWVNIAANAGNRPSGYTGLQLDSGTTYAGNTSFPAPGGGNETGHSGYGYARITRIS